MSLRAVSPPPRATTPEPILQPLPSPRLRPSRSIGRLKPLNTSTATTTLSSHDNFHLTFDEFGTDHRKPHPKVSAHLTFIILQTPKNLARRPNERGKSPVRRPRPYRTIPTITNHREDLGLLLPQLTTILHLHRLCHHSHHSSSQPGVDPRTATASIYRVFRYPLQHLRLLLMSL